MIFLFGGGGGGERWDKLNIKGGCVCGHHCCWLLTSNLLVVTIFLLQIWWGASTFHFKWKKRIIPFSTHLNTKFKRSNWKKKLSNPNYNQIFKFHNCSFKESSSTSAHYVALQKKIGWRKVKTCQFGSGKRFCPTILHRMLNLVKGPRNLTSVVDWLDSLIGPGGLLLLVSGIRAIPVLVLWVGLRKVNN
jgi:hypothetical protein